MEDIVIWGRNPIVEALKSGKSVEKIYVAHDSHPHRELVRLAKDKGVKIQRVSRKKIEELAGTKKTQGVVALISAVRYVPFYELFRETIDRNSFLLVIDHITDPQNVGNLIRTCEVLGGAGVLITKENTSPINQTVIKASSGAIFHLKVSKTSSLIKPLREFKNMGGWVFSIEKGGKDIGSFDIAKPCALVLGAEDRGVSKGVLELSDEVLSIPMSGKTTSLNVSSAGAIAMWEAVRSCCAQ